MEVRLLHLEDSPQDAWLLQRSLRDEGWDVAVQVVNGRQELLSHIDLPWDAVLADFGLPGFSTAEALRLVREKQPLMPFVVVSGQIGEENAVALMKAGADDYVSKSYPRRLSPILKRLIEERRAREEQQRQQSRHRDLENRFQQFFHRNLSGMAMLTLSGEIQEVNQALIDLLGLDPRRLPPFWTLFSSSDLAGQVRHRLETGRPYGPEVVEMVGPDGSKAFLLSTYQLPGTTPLVWANFIDHTEQRQLQEKVFQIRKLESLGQLAGGIAHEFNNILAIFQGHLELLGHDLTPDSPLIPRVEVLQRTTLRGASIVKQLLVLARRRPLNQEPIHLEDLLTETARLVTGLFPENLVLRIVVPGALPPILGDRDQLGQALLNLLINARDAMPQGGTIILGARSLDSGDQPSMIRVEVADEGIGIPPEVVDQIFDPFFTTKEEGKGTGLGLSLVASVVQAHRGKVGVEARTPRGSLFYLLLPVSPVASLEDSSPMAPVSQPPPEDSTVLLVENETDLLDFERQVLERNRYRVVGCRNGDDAWALLKEMPQEVSLVVTDLGMPGIGGEAFCRLVRSLPAPPALVVQSGNFEPGVRARLEELGVRHFLIKPFLPTDFLSTIHAALTEQEASP